MMLWNGVIITCLVVTAMYSCQSAVIDTDETSHLENIVKQRRLREAGFNVFELCQSRMSFQHQDQSNSLTVHHLRQKRDAGTIDDQPIKLHITGDNHVFEMNMKYTPSVINRNARVNIHQNNITSSRAGLIQDCSLIGHLHDDVSTMVSVSFCNELKGMFTDTTHEYWFESIDDNNSDVELAMTVLIAKKPVNKIGDVSWSPTNIQNIIETAQTKETHSRRHKRAIPTEITVEIVLIVDEDYVIDTGKTDEEIAEIMNLKWNLVQAEWDSVHITVILDIKLLVIWRENPSWFTISSNLETTLSRICQYPSSPEPYSDFDHIHLFTGHEMTGAAIGKAYRSEICKPNRKCAVSVDTSVTNFVIAAHELGHQLGMYHDEEIADYCSIPGNSGMMGATGIIHGFSNCSTLLLDWLFNDENADSSPGCLEITNVNYDNFTAQLIGQWPGMGFTDDEICEMDHAAGYRYSSYPFSVYPECATYSCVNLDATSDTYGMFFKHQEPIDGHRCGENMVCSADIIDNAYQCIALADTGVDSSQYAVQTGVWSEWGSQTECSRTCGTGVQYRQRFCNNPKPLNTVWCVGNEYDVALCNKDPCSGDSTTTSTLIEQRAGETCTSLKRNNLYPVIGQVSDNYLNTGKRQTGSIHGQCEVKCDGNNYTPTTYQRYGIIPDGTPCDLEEIPFPDQHGLPIQSGLYGTCVQGNCLEIDCNDQSNGATYDGCGVCGGDATSCQVFEGLDVTVVAINTRETILNIPAEAYNIQIYFLYPDQQNYFIELFAENGTTIHSLPSSVGSADTTGNPINHAGTLWYFMFNKQYLWAVGPLSEAVDIKLYNNGNNENNGITYSYSLPLGPTTTSTSTSTSTTTSATTATTSTPTTTSTTPATTTTTTTTATEATTPTSTTPTTSTPQPTTPTTTANNGAPSPVPTTPSTASTTTTTIAVTTATKSKNSWNSLARCKKRWKKW